MFDLGVPVPKRCIACTSKAYSRPFPILLDRDQVDGGPKPFRFKKMWFEDESLLPLLKEWWEELEEEGDPGSVFWNKLNGLKEKIKVQNKEVFGQVETKIKEELKSIFDLDVKEKSQDLALDEAVERKACKERLEALLRLEEIK